MSSLSLRVQQIESLTPRIRRMLLVSSSAQRLPGFTAGCTLSCMSLAIALNAVPIPWSTCPTASTTKSPSSSKRRAQGDRAGCTR